MADISFNIARKELKIAQIAQLYQLFRLSHLFHIYGHGFCELSRMLMRKNVNNDVSKDSPIDSVCIASWICCLTTKWETKRVSGVRNANSALFH